MKFITIISLAGLIPFYIPEFRIQNYDLFQLQHVQIYGFMIICFLCGMQWERVIFNNSTNFFQKILPLAPVLFGILLLMLKLDSNYLLISLFLFVLFLDLFFYRKLLSKNYMRLRIIVTCLVVLSFLGKSVN